MSTRFGITNPTDKKYDYRHINTDDAGWMQLIGDGTSLTITTRYK